MYFTLTSLVEKNLSKFDIPINKAKILLIGFSSYKIHQKYFEPWFIMIMFLMIKTSITNNFLKKISNIIFLKLFFIVYLFVAIINYIFQITNNYEI